MNETRVHLWYEAHFGYRIDPYASVEDAINTWPTTATSIGVRRGGRGRRARGAESEDAAASRPVL